MNAIDPSMSGRQTCWCACAASRALRVAAYVLTLKNTVPIDWTPHAHQSIRAGCHAIHRRRPRAPPATSVGALIAWKNWRYPALVKKIDPAKNVIASAAAPTALA